MFWKIVLVLGILGVLLGLLVTGVSVALPIVNGPNTSWDEAMLGIIPGTALYVYAGTVAGAVGGADAEGEFEEGPGSFVVQ